MSNSPEVSPHSSLCNSLSLKTAQEEAGGWGPLDGLGRGPAGLAGVGGGPLDSMEGQVGALGWEGGWGGDPGCQGGMGAPG